MQHTACNSKDSFKYNMDIYLQMQLNGICFDITLDYSSIGGKNQETWTFLNDMIDVLGAAGMSSDESDQEEDGKRIYYIKRREWRSSAISAYLQLIDHERKKTNDNGNNHAGNEPRERRRYASSPASTCDPVIGLPINFYNKTWYANLTDKQKRDLGALDGVRVPERLRGLTQKAHS